MTDGMTSEQAIALSESGFWEDMTPDEIARFQLHTDMLCMPFGVFHEAVEMALGRPVWTHEFASPGRLIAELDGDAPQPSMMEILELIPAEKRIVVMVDEDSSTTDEGAQA